MRVFATLRLALLAILASPLVAQSTRGLARRLGDRRGRRGAARRDGRGAQPRRSRPARVAVDGCGRRLPPRRASAPGPTSLLPPAQLRRGRPPGRRRGGRRGGPRGRDAAPLGVGRRARDRQADVPQPGRRDRAGREPRRHRRRVDAGRRRPRSRSSCARSRGPATSSRRFRASSSASTRGEGKANQYYLRGFNLDHGTDFATTVAGMPGQHARRTRTATATRT